MCFLTFVLRPLLRPFVTVVLKYFNNDDYYIFDQARNAIVRFPNNEPFFINLDQMRLNFPQAFTTEVRRGFFSGKIKE